MRPMLAHKYKDHRKTLRYPLYAQPKLNGVRMLYNDGKCQSRDEEIWSTSTLAGVRAALTNVPENIVLDGELYCHGMSLQKINSRIAVSRVNRHEDESSIEYHIFDLLDLSQPTLDFSYRHQLLVGIIQPQYPCISVETRLIRTEGEGEAYHKLNKDRNYEGTMYRDPSSMYGLVENCGNQENRWKCLLKRKDFIDGEFPIIGIKEGEGQFENSLGALVLRMPNGETGDVGSGFSISERDEYWNNPPLDQLCRIRYEMMSDKGIPLKPVFEAVL